MWDASRSDPGALSERQRRAEQVLPERRSSVISEALAARASPSSAESIANLTVGGEPPPRPGLVPTGQGDLFPV
jgi:hypothetical protein